LIGVRVFAERQPAVATSALAFAVLNNMVASTMFLAVYGFDLATFADRGALVDRGPGVADVLRWAAVIDMVGYLALAPVVIYLHGRLILAAERVGHPGLVGPLTFCGLAFVLVGSIGAVLMASVGPALLEAGTREPLARTAARVAFEALASAVYVGLWGILELLLFGAWLIGIARFVRAEGRLFSGLTTVVGVGAVAYAARAGLTGRLPTDDVAPVDILILGALGLIVVWAVWLAARLWRGR
jgi:hypothetical protein